VNQYNPLDSQRECGRRGDEIRIDNEVHCMGAHRLCGALSQRSCEVVRPN